MKLMRTTPGIATAVRDDFDRLVDRLFTTPLLPAWSEQPATEWAPSLDFSETDKEYIVRVEAPGVPKDDIDVNLEGQVLTVSGHRETSHEEKTEEYFWKERSAGRFLRSVRLPSAVKMEGVEAKCSDGVITVKVPKAETAIKNRIAVK